MDLLGLQYKLSFLVHPECLRDLDQYIRRGRTLTTLFGEREIHLNRDIGYHGEFQTVYTLYQGEGIHIDFEVDKGYIFRSSDKEVETADWDELKQIVMTSS